MEMEGGGKLKRAAAWVAAGVMVADAGIWLVLGRTLRSDARRKETPGQGRMS